VTPSDGYGVHVSVSPGHPKCMVGGIEGVVEVMLTCELMWREARVERLGMGGGF